MPRGRTGAFSFHNVKAALGGFDVERFKVFRNLSLHRFERVVGDGLCEFSKALGKELGPFPARP